MKRVATGTLPLAFMMAISAESAGARPPLPQANEALRPGMLSGLVRHAFGLDAVAGNPEESGDRRLPGDKTAQFFPNFPNFPNFFNCFSGTWRKC